jgi:hypothetical protein
MPRHLPNYPPARGGARLPPATSCASSARQTALPSMPPGLTRRTGGIGSILRREGVYSSTLCDWRRQRDAGAFGALTPVRRGLKIVQPNPLVAEVALLQRNVAHLTRCLARAEAIIAVQKNLRTCWGSRWHPTATALTEAVVALVPVSGMTAAVCAAVGVSRATVERRRAGLAAPLALARPLPTPARALTAPQQLAVLDRLHAPRFADQAPAEIYATLLDEGVYHCSIRTMYRILGQNGEVRERRQQLRHPIYQKPELLADQRFVGASQAGETRGKSPTRSGPGTSPS